VNRVLGIVPARGGSKGVPGKNARLLNGRPLIEYTANAALAAATLSRVIVSTDDERIASIAERCGLEVPFLRPASLATDTTPTLPVVQHALSHLEREGDRFDAVVILQPTTPLRPSAVIDRCVEQLFASSADCVVTVVPVPAEYNPHWVYFQQSDGSLQLSTGEAAPIPRRQDLPPAYRREGSVYATRRSVVDRGTLFGDRVVGWPVLPEECVDINTPDDWNRAERMLRALTSTTHEDVRLSSSNR
jgi:CMP-N,N'-diacetyllegionaminic acid synthase